MAAGCWVGKAVSLIAIEIAKSIAAAKAAGQRACQWHISLANAIRSLIVTTGLDPVVRFPLPSRCARLPPPLAGEGKEGAESTVLIAGARAPESAVADFGLRNQPIPGKPGIGSAARR